MSMIPRTPRDVIRALPPDELWNRLDALQECAGAVAEEIALYDAALDDWFVAQFAQGVRKTNRAIASEVGRSETAVRNRIQRLEREGRIDPNRPKDPRGGARKVKAEPASEPDDDDEVVDGEVAPEPSARTARSDTPLRPEYLVTRKEREYANAIRQLFLTGIALADEVLSEKWRPTALILNEIGEVVADVHVTHYGFHSQTTTKGDKRGNCTNQ